MNDKHTAAKDVPKLSLKVLNAQPKVGDIKEGDPTTWLAHFYGVLRKADTISTSFGDSTRFSGEFEGVNLKTGETLHALRMFAPGEIEELMQQALASRIDRSVPVSFAVEVGALFSEKSARGYLYVCRPIVKAESRDLLAEVRAESNKARQLVLAAPDSDKKTEAKAEKKK